MFTVASKATRPRVKICGITTWADAKLAVDCGADALGFNFYSLSPRYVSATEAKQIARRLPDRIARVGIYVNEPASIVASIAHASGMNWVQLHGAETPAIVGELAQSYGVIKAFRVRRNFRPAALRRFARAAAFLLDGFRKDLRGGTGKLVDWRIARAATRYGPIILAGGLGPQNVARAIAEVHPFAIDVCSGVESRPGKKDSRKVRELMNEVERARREWK